VDHLKVRGFAVGVFVASLALIALMLIAARADAAERIFWDNYSDSPVTIASANLDGSGASLLNLAGVEVESPEGMSYDSASGRLFVASSGTGEQGQILWFNIDGTGGGVLSTPGAPLDDPTGIAVDPANGTVYWVNADGNGEAEGSIAFAKLDGSGGGMLNTSGAELDNPYRLAIDPAAGRVYWTNQPGPNPVISYANLDNSGGGGNLPVSGVAEGVSNDGLAVDSAAGRIYWVGEEAVSYASLSSGVGGELPLAGANYDAPYGLAIDPALGKVYWANYGVKTGEPGGLGFESLTGTNGGAISPVGASANGLQDPVIVKSPSGTAAPQVSKSAANPAALSCSAGGWAPDYAGSFVYQAPQTYAYQWTDNGAPIAGATTSSLTATSPGSYACTVTATNPLGSASQGSAAASLTAAKLKLTTKKKVSVKAGKPATFKVKAVNQGDFATAHGAKLCVKVAKKAKKAVKAPKCKSVGGLAALGSRTLKLKLKTTKKAAGKYKVSFTLKGASGSAAKAKVVVKAKKHKKHKAKAGKKGK
jgi:DNA-binding beta-propeller fold protein YncE